jgi:hypothetical protein
LSRKDGAGKRCHGLNRGTDHITRNEAELLCAELTNRSDIMKKEIASAMGEVLFAIVVIEIASQRRHRYSLKRFLSLLLKKTSFVNLRFVWSFKKTLLLSLSVVIILYVYNVT